jgi:5-methyltetrahydrofolate--homocysteine methyltransferase
MTVKRDEFRRLTGEKVFILDGATGTELQKRGLPAGACPELWGLEHEDVLRGIHFSYAQAGSEVVTTNTFGANRIKLKHFALEDRVEELNHRAVVAARRAVADKCLVAGSIGPLGRLLEPNGDLSFEHAYDCFKEQVSALAKGGADLILIETMMDVQEARCALLAAKDACNLPVWVSLTYEKGRTLTGSDPVTALITLQAMGADAVGSNCSTGPEQMISILQAQKPYAGVPLLVQPNAGLPRLEGGRTRFDLTPEEFRRFMRPLHDAGASMIGGCCGTDPEFIKAAAEELKNCRPHKLTLDAPDGLAALTSRSKSLFLGPGFPLRIIGDQLNPSGRPKLTRQLLSGEVALAKEIALRQAKEGADIIDVNVGTFGADEAALLKRLALELAVTVDTPLAFDSANEQCMEEALKIYPGRALINSITGERRKREALLPLVKRYGSMFVLLPLNEKGIPETAEGRLEIVRDVVAEADSLGISRKSIIVDGLVLAESSHPGAARETLKVIEACAHELGLLAMCGLSNVSFGLPQRPWMDAAFLAMCAQSGISLLNANPGSQHHRAAAAASDVLTGRDPHALRYIKRMKEEEVGQTQDSEQTQVTFDPVYEAVLNGYGESILSLVEGELSSGRSPLDIINNSLLPALNRAGERLSQGETFLPQLMLSSKAAQAAFDRLEREFSGRPLLKRGRVLLATVKGDIHDLGKNLVGLLLKNHGFEVIDLGVDVASEAIIEEARKRAVDLIGLSALMTTTMHSMKEVVELARSRKLNIPVMVGGAVLTAEYARRFQADGYAADAVEAVKVAARLIEEGKRLSE